MLVKDAVASALTLLGRADVLSALSDTENATAEQRELIDILLYCFNAVEDELARHYIPLTAKEELFSPNCCFYFNLWTHKPLRVKKVTCGGRSLKYEVRSNYLYAEATDIAVEYEYAPVSKTLGQTSDYGDEVGSYLIALGIAAEYSLINGEAEMADEWEKKYRIRLDGVQRTLPACEHIPPRRWV